MEILEDWSEVRFPIAWPFSQENEGAEGLAAAQELKIAKARRISLQVKRLKGHRKQEQCPSTPFLSII